MATITRSSDAIRIRYGKGQPTEQLYGVFLRGVAHIKQPATARTGCGQRLGLAPVTAALAKVRCGRCLAYLDAYLMQVQATSDATAAEYLAAAQTGTSTAGESLAGEFTARETGYSRITCAGYGARSDSSCSTACSPFDSQSSSASRRRMTGMRL